MRLVLAIVLASLFMPSATWAQTAPGAEYDAAKRSIQQAIVNTYKYKWTREAQEEWKQVSTLDKIRSYLNQPANSLDSWIRIAQGMGMPVGTKLGPPSARDTGYCNANPQALICRSSAPTNGGGGAGGTWGDTPCEDLPYTLDFGGNLLVPALNLPEPRGYKYGETLWQATTDSLLRLNEPWASIKVKLHMENNPLEASERYAPAYATQYCASSACTFTVHATRSAYYSGGVLQGMRSKAVSVGILPTSIAWNQGTGYGEPPPTDYECPDGIGMGANNQHWKACIRPPAMWSIPTMASIVAADLKKWAEGSNSANCAVSDEFIRFLADQAYKNACADGSCDIPYSRVEKEDVKTGGQQPTIKDTGNVGSLPEPNGEAGNPVTQPTETPTQQGPDWTDPGTQAPNPQSPTAQSIFDKAWDWGFPEIEINLGSAECPIYTAQFYTYTLTLDSHCPFIEQNRAAISALMILLFTIACGIIVLRA
ncbi:hypothetical protein VF14_35405 [Nostoc linckia z18]|uniref:hypothetical protein n=1 Tax=Nostoc linckia TaxID=92942 RepID=UPI000BFFCE8B|nr:hypothetical protein [Nostoc linckia]PHK28012.1 hypothetical protein VF14_35405 [Nostoc linckia z18]